MKKTKIFTAALLAALPLAMSAQINETPMHAGGRMISTKKAEAGRPQGSMFVNDNYTYAVQESTGAKLMLRYNAYHDEFEMKNLETNQAAPLNKVAGDRLTFNLGKSVYVYTDYIDAKGEPAVGYLNILAETPTATIYKKDKVILQAAVESDNSYKASKPAMYKKGREEFYIRLKDGKITELPDSKKDFAKLFPGKDKEVLDYIKQNKIDLDDQQDLQKLEQLFRTI